MKDDKYIVRKKLIKDIMWPTSFVEMSNIPNLWGNIVSSSSWDSIQSIKYSTYFGADTSIGFLIVTPSAHRYSYL